MCFYVNTWQPVHDAKHARAYHIVRTHARSLGCCYEWHEIYSVKHRKSVNNVQCQTQFHALHNVCNDALLDDQEEVSVEKNIHWCVIIISWSIYVHTLCLNRTNSAKLCSKPQDHVIVSYMCT